MVSESGLEEYTVAFSFPKWLIWIYVLCDYICNNLYQTVYLLKEGEGKKRGGKEFGTQKRSKTKVKIAFYM